MIMLFRKHVRHFIFHPLRVFRIIYFQNCMDLIYFGRNSAWSAFFRSLCLHWTFSFIPTKRLRNNLCTLSLNFSISVFQLHCFLWTVTKFSSNFFGQFPATLQSSFSFTCSWFNIKCFGIPNGFSLHKKSLFSFPVLTAVYISTFILQSFLNYCHLDFCPISFSLSL